jgi:hypothetical protein
MGADRHFAFCRRPTAKPRRCLTTGAPNPSAVKVASTPRSIAREPIFD